MYNCSIYCIVINLFQRELEMKDDIIGRLNEELIKKDGQVRAEVKKYWLFVSKLIVHNSSGRSSERQI
jgi:hypothetical protein